MALLDKDILITPNKGQTTEPKIEFKGASTTLGPQTISLNVYPTSNGTVSFEGSAGQLFSITNDLTGTIFSVNDVSGIPSIEVNADGTVTLAEFSGNVGIGTASPNASALLDAQSTTKGVRMPNMTTTQKNAVASPAAGLIIFDTTLSKLCVYTGAAWQTITSA